MFENYMDYTDDACVTTFTRNQATRCQAAMDNSPRRLTLITSKACQARPANSIQFGTAASYSTLETGTAGNCPNSRSYSFNIYVSGAATGAATVTFNNTGGTALLNSDYTFTPASVTYTAGDNAVKRVTLTIVDDQVAEPIENIIISYSISGMGVIAGPDKQTLSISIIDDDVSGIAVNNITPTKTVFTENFNAASTIPTGWTTSVFDDGSGSYTPNQWVVSANGGVGTTGNAAHVTRNLTTKVNQYDNLKIADAYLITPLINASGLKDIILRFKWRCLGEVSYDEGYIGYIPEGQAPIAANVNLFNITFGNLAAGTTAATANLTLPLSLSNSKFYLVFNWYNDETIGGNPPFTIDDVTVTGNFFSVATTTDADTAFSHFIGQSVFYYSKATTSPFASRLIATISNPSQNLNCVAASIQNAGMGKTVLATTSGSYFRTNKVIKLAPATANSTATYQATFYFSTAELSTAWTVGEIPLLKILKVRDGVSLAGTLTSADAEIITPIFVDNSVAGGSYSYTGNFTGFSQFMLVSPTAVIPVRFISFDATAKRSAILLQWSTSQEVNYRGFSIERSTNAINFETIGWVNGRGNSNVQTNYTFSDNFVQPATVYYYRLRQVNLDSREDLSSIRQARINKQGIAVTISPVPAKDILQVYLAGTTQKATIQLINAQGQIVKTWSNVDATNSSYGIQVQSFPSGIYTLKIILPDENIVKKIVIEK